MPSISKMKICHVITRMIVGGAQENTLFSILGHLEHGHDAVLVTGPSPGPEGELLRNVDFPDFEIVQVPNLQRELNPIKDFLAYRNLRKFFAERKFDVIHTHSSKAGIIGRAAAWKARVPVVVHTVHGQAFHPYEKAWKNRIYIAAERWAAARCHKIFAVCQAMIDQCVSVGVAPVDKYKVVYSGMAVERFLDAVPEPELRSRLGIPQGVRVVGSVARLFPLKGYEYLIPAARAIVAAHPDVHFLIVGNGSMRDELEQQIADLGLTDRFHFAGLVPPHEVYRYVALMNILLHLSLREGLPRSVVQALAAGKPAVSFRLDGAPEVIIDGETGFCAIPRNIDDVVAATSRILSRPDLARKMGENGRKMVAEKFNWRRMVDILENEYRQIL